MKKLTLFILLIFSALLSTAQSDGFIVDCLLKGSSELVYGFNVSDTSQKYWCGYYSNAGFNIGANLGIGGTIEIVNMGDRGHVDLANPDRTAMHLGRPNIDPWVHRDSCGRVYYDDFCTGWIEDECGDTIAVNHKFYFGIAAQSGYAVYKKNDSTFVYNNSCDNFLENTYGPIDTLLAYSPFINDTSQAVLGANYSDTYAQGTKRNYILINNNQLAVGGHYYLNYKVKFPPSVNQGANLASDQVRFPFVFLKAKIKATQYNPEGYYNDVKGFIPAPVPAPPANVNVILTGKGRHQETLLTWDASPGACSYIVTVQISLKRNAGFQTMTTFANYDTSITIDLPRGQYRCLVAAKNGSGTSSASSSSIITIK